MTNDNKKIHLLYEFKKIGLSLENINELKENNMLNEDVLDKVKKYGKGAIAGLGVAALGAAGTGAASNVADKITAPFTVSQEIKDKSRNRYELASSLKEVLKICRDNKIGSEGEQVDIKWLFDALASDEYRIETKSGREHLKKDKEYPDDQVKAASLYHYNYSNSLANNKDFVRLVHKFINTPNKEDFNTIIEFINKAKNQYL